MLTEHFIDASAYLNGKLLEGSHCVLDLCAPSTYCVMPRTSGCLPWLHVRITWRSELSLKTIVQVHSVLICLMWGGAWASV